MKIYTRKGDGGKTRLFGGTEVSKHDIRTEAYGTVDELNSFVGMLRNADNSSELNSVIESIQNRLFTIGSHLASDPSKANLSVPEIKETDILFLEKEIDRMEEGLPPLKNFILTGGHSLVSWCHIARTVCRRAERRVVELNEKQAVGETVLKYLNRLSDYFFVLARHIGKNQNIAETPWKP